MSKITNHAAYLPKARAYPLEIREAPLTTLEPNAIRVRVHTLAINPIDHILQTQGTSIGFPWVKYPLVLGFDIAGTVVELAHLLKISALGIVSLAYAWVATKRMPTARTPKPAFRSTASFKHIWRARFLTLCPSNKPVLYHWALAPRRVACFSKTLSVWSCQNLARSFPKIKQCSYGDDRQVLARVQYNLLLHLVTTSSLLVRPKITNTVVRVVQSTALTTSHRQLVKTFWLRCEAKAALELWLSERTRRLHV
jgi:hypothetical protein